MPSFEERLAASMQAAAARVTKKRQNKRAQAYRARRRTSMTTVQLERSLRTSLGRVTEPEKRERLEAQLAEVRASEEWLTHVQEREAAQRVKRAARARKAYHKNRTEETLAAKREKMKARYEADPTKAKANAAKQYEKKVDAQVEAIMQKRGTRSFAHQQRKRKNVEARYFAAEEAAFAATRRYIADVQLGPPTTRQGITERADLKRELDAANAELAEAKKEYRELPKEKPLTKAQQAAMERREAATAQKSRESAAKATAAAAAKRNAAKFEAPKEPSQAKQIEVAEAQEDLSEAMDREQKNPTAENRVAVRVARAKLARARRALQGGG